MRRHVKSLLRRLGYDIVRYDPGSDGFPEDADAAEKRIYRTVKPFTTTTIERVVSLVRAVRHVVQNGIAGDIVECGVWRGGSMMAVALALQDLGATSRELHLFDTYTGMTAPSEKDRRPDGKTATEIMSALPADVMTASLDDVRRNLASTGYPAQHIHYVAGKVEDTLPAAAPERIALLRLDTDWYESTRHELVHLYPRLVSGGIMIIDDYGFWRGAREATDEYFAAAGSTPFLHRIDYTARLIVKP